MDRDLEANIYPKVNGVRTLSKKERHLKELRDNLKGKSLQIYYFLTKNPEYHGVREIQRIFDYSSPNLAHYHLKRLYEAELLEKNDKNEYKVIDNPVKLGILEDQMRILDIWIPHSFVYAMSLVVLALFSFLFYLLDLPTFIYPITSIPVLVIIAIQLIRDGMELFKLKPEKDSD